MEDAKQMHGTRGRLSQDGSFPHGHDMVQKHSPQPFLDHFPSEPGLVALDLNGHITRQSVSTSRSLSS